jgi:hypothetical protein
MKQEKTCVQYLHTHMSHEIINVSNHMTTQYVHIVIFKFDEFGMLCSQPTTHNNLSNTTHKVQNILHMYIT